MAWRGVIVLQVVGKVDKSGVMGVPFWRAAKYSAKAWARVVSERIGTPSAFDRGGAKAFWKRRMVLLSLWVSKASVACLACIARCRM